MRSFMLLATAAAVILAGTATGDAAPRKKPHASADRPVAAKHKRHVTRPVSNRPWNQPWQANQGWPTSVNDGSFSYGIGPGGSMR
jgi:hypothetical protein